MPSGAEVAAFPTLAGMGMTNFRLSLEKRYSALTGELEDVRASIERIKREVEKLPQLEERIPELQKLIESASLLLQDADPDWQPEKLPPSNHGRTAYRCRSVMVRPGRTNRRPRPHSKGATAWVHPDAILQAPASRLKRPPEARRPYAPSHRPSARSTWDSA